MTIRRLRTTDLLWYLIDGPRLGPSLAQTWDRVGKGAENPPSTRSVAGGLALHRERERGSVLTEGMHLRALASVRTRSGPKAWEVHLLNLPPRSNARESSFWRGYAPWPASRAASEFSCDCRH